MSYNYDQINAGYYDKIYRRGNGVQSRWHRNKFSFVEDRLPNSGLIVDIGCGPGTFIGSLDDDSRQFIGIDTAAKQIEYAIETYGRTSKKFFQVSAPPYPIEDNSANAVTAIELVEHLNAASIQEFLSEAYRILQPGGYLFLTTPNYGSLWPLLEWVVGKISPLSYDEQHITKFTRTSLMDLIETSKFQQNTIVPFMLSVPFAAAINWRIADITEALEPNFLARRLGFLLFCEAQKPAVKESN